MATSTYVPRMCLHIELIEYENAALSLSVA